MADWLKKLHGLHPAGSPIRHSGILGNYEGHVAKPELPTNVYRVDQSTGRMAVVAGDINRPNGLCFSPDEERLYVIEAWTLAARDSRV